MDYAQQQKNWHKTDLTGVNEYGNLPRCPFVATTLKTYSAFLLSFMEFLCF